MSQDTGSPTPVHSPVGPMEQWVRRWGQPNESGDRIWFTGEIHTFDEQSGTPDTIIPIFDFARQQDAIRADLIAALEAMDIQPLLAAIADWQEAASPLGHIGKQVVQLALKLKGPQADARAALARASGAV